MNRLAVTIQAAVLRALVEGNSIRATARLTGTAKATVLTLLVELGEFCSLYQDHVLRSSGGRGGKATAIFRASRRRTPTPS